MFSIGVFRDRITNGVTEGINNKIKFLKRIAYGLPNFAHLRARILIEFTSEISAPPEAQRLSKTQLDTSI